MGAACSSRKKPLDRNPAMIHWVDDLLVFGNSNAKREELMSRMEKPNGGKYTLERMGVASWFLGIQMLQTD